MNAEVPNGFDRRKRRYSASKLTAVAMYVLFVLFFLFASSRAGRCVRSRYIHSGSVLPGCSEMVVFQ